MNFARVLGVVGLVTTAKLEQERSRHERDRAIAANREDDLRGELFSAKAHASNLARQLELVGHQYEETAAALNAAVKRAYTAEDRVTELQERVTELIATVDEQNQLIAELQRQRPQSQLQLFEPPSRDDEQPAAGDRVVQDHHVTLVCRIVAIFFKGRSHWILERGDSQFKTPVHDRAFLDGVHQRSYAFADGDLIEAEFHEVTTEHGDGKLSVERTLERVVRVITPDKQIPLTEAMPAIAASPNEAAANGEETIP